MGTIVNTFAFPKTECSYDETLAHLSFIKVTDKYEIPICFYIKNKSLPYIIYSHANAEDIGHFNIEKLSDVFNANMLLYDYAGYGMHTCKTSNETNCYTDITHVYEFLANQGITCDQVVLYGRSIGTGVACNLAYQLSKENKCCKLILVSPFKSVIQVVANLPNLPFDIFRIEKMAPQITCDVMIIHGCQDKVTDYQQSKQLSKLFPKLYKFVTLHKCGHHYMFRHPQYYEEIHEFIHYQFVA